jgi:hypothetical protein
MSVNDGLQLQDVRKHPALVVYQEEPLNILTETNQQVRDIGKGKLDSVVLRYMARRLHLTLCQLQPCSWRRKSAQVYKLQERGGRMHRIALYQPEKLRVQEPLSFVGFISARQKHLRPSIVQEIRQADKKLVEELAGVSGILSYSSLELRNGDWCNLVVMNDVGAKTHIKDSETHKYATFHLAHSYYQWIRLHTGVMPEGLDHMEMQLQKTRYYAFQEGQQRPSIREFIYELPCGA